MEVPVTNIGEAFRTAQAMLSGGEWLNSRERDLAAAVVLLHGRKAPAVSQAVMDAIAERNRQQTVEGWTPAHDDQYHQNELVIAAIGYAAATEFRRRDQTSVMSRIHGGVFTGWFRWPFNWSWWKPKDHRRDLIKAIALLLAEVERFDREIARSRPGELP